jgi:hypothetical protein
MPDATDDLPDATDDLPDATEQTDEDLVERLWADDVAADGWEAEPPLETLHCHPDLIQRLTEIARPAGVTRRAFVDGCPVITYGRYAIAAAAGTSWLVVRSDRPAGALATVVDVSELGPAWQSLDPWTVDVAFAKGTDLLRSHVVRAMELAEAHAWR